MPSNETRCNFLPNHALESSCTALWLETSFLASSENLSGYSLRTTSRPLSSSSAVDVDVENFLDGFAAPGMSGEIADGITGIGAGIGDLSPDIAGIDGMDTDM